MKTTKISAALLCLGLALTGCTAAQAPAEQHNVQQAQTLQAVDTWAKAAKEGMSAGFGTLSNTGDDAVVITGVTDAEGDEIQIHETAGAGESASMKQLEDGLRIEPGQQVVLEPGGTHLMFMDLKKPLVPAGKIALNLEFADGSSTPVDFEIRNFTGANESYEHGAHEKHHG